MSADFKQTLWKAADKLRAQMDAAEYKHIILGLIFLKFVSDKFEERRAELIAQAKLPFERQSALPIVKRSCPRFFPIYKNS